MSNEPTDPRGNANGNLLPDNFPKSGYDGPRNHLGHWNNCPYWDWRDFSKCQCEDGLACITESTIHTVSPMPLRDFFAAMVNVPPGFIMPESIARQKYEIADAMIQARSIPEKQVDEGAVTD